MVCGRCKMVVKSEFEKLGLQPISVELGEVELKDNISEEQKKRTFNASSCLRFRLNR